MQPQSRILIVDDHPANVEVLKKVFGGRHQLATAASGDKALVEAHSFRPDIILLDVMMPHMDGFETCRKLQRIADVPVIFLTAVTDETGEWQYRG